ncbi:hypothetical protein [Nocardioides humilatus]|uniref:hypothetical protein n=1 Tax=Nocardioides humilatus TaxID=2607660 RepID=UPI00165EEFF3|nr:hypothetical protein [Nocardioides humilatus]
MTEAAYGRIRRRLRRRNDRLGTYDDGAARATSDDPQPTLIPTNLGKDFDERVAAAVGRQPPRGQDPDYDLVRDNFDIAHYLLQAPGVMDNPEIDPVRHFLRLGAGVKLTPDPNFSTDSYLKRHPERRDSEVNPYTAWLRDGRAAGEIAEPVMGIEKLADVLGISTEEVVEHLAERRSDVHRRLHHGKLGEMFAKATEVEPLIGELWPEVARPRMMPVPWLVVADQLGALHSSQKALGFARARVVLVVGHADNGLVVRVIEALRAEVDPSEIVVVTTAAEAPEGEAPAGVRRVDFAVTAAGLGPLMAQQVLVELLRSLCADAIVGIGSRLFLDALTPYGKALRASERIYLGFGALRPGPLGHEVGTSTRYFYRHVEHVDGVFVDTDETEDRLIEDYGLPKVVAERIRSVADDAVLADLARRLLQGDADD